MDWEVQAFREIRKSQTSINNVVVVGDALVENRCEIWKWVV